MHWMVLLMSVIAAVAAQFLLKSAAGAPSLVDQVMDRRTIAGLAIYGLSAMLYITALRRIPLSVALPCTALSYFVVAAIGFYGFEETLGPQKLVALAIIGCGVVLLATS